MTFFDPGFSPSIPGGYGNVTTGGGYGWGDVVRDAVGIGVGIWQQKQQEDLLKLQRDIARAQAQGQVLMHTQQQVPDVILSPGTTINVPAPTGPPTQASPAPGGMTNVAGNQTQTLAARVASPFVPTMAGARAQPFVAVNPVSQRLTWFKPAGRPVLWSGDLTACKRVNKLARRARRARR